MQAATTGPGLLGLRLKYRFGQDEPSHRFRTILLEILQDLSDRTVILMDPMLATGNSACAAASLLKTRGARDIRFVCLLAAPEGIAQFQHEHPDVPIWTAAIDERLNDHGYILPGLGDAGDRMFGTK